MPKFLLSIGLAAATTLTMAAAARADCESDLVQLEDAYKAPALTPAARAVLDDAKTTSVSALKKDDDAACHRAIADALGKIGAPLK